jgi:peptidoglycan/LPS O-acetylase OafA/YrhL
MPAERFDSFDLLRAAGALLVLVSHSFVLTGRPEPGVPGADTLGGLGVAIFFSISGYLIALSWRRDPRPGAFLVKRSLRIFPALGVAVVLAAFLLGPVVTRLPAGTYLASPETWGYLCNIGLYIVYPLPGVFEGLPHPRSVNGSLWTLPIEFTMYLIVAMVGVFCRGRAWAYAAVFTVFAALAITWLPAQNQATIVYAMDARYLAIFGTYYFAGASIAAFRLERRLTTPLHSLLLLSLLATYSEPRAFTAVLWIALPAAAVSLGRSGNRASAWLSAKGDFSYGLYIYAFPVQQTLVMLWPAPPIVPYIAVVLAATLAFAVASWHWIERPALGWKARLTGRTRAGHDAAAAAEHAVVEH